MRQADAYSLHYVKGWLMPRTRQTAVDRLPHWKTIYGRVPEPGRAE